MKRHIKVYMAYFDYGEQDYIPSELSGQRAVDIHHLSPRGMGGSKEKDEISNLMALTREEHDDAESQKYSEDYLRTIHLHYLDYFRRCGRTWHESKDIPEKFKWNVILTQKRQSNEISKS